MEQLENYPQSSSSLSVLHLEKIQTPLKEYKQCYWKDGLLKNNCRENCVPRVILEGTENNSTVVQEA